MLVRKFDVYILCQNNIPVFSPALTDGSLGDMIYFHSFRNPGLVLDIVEGKSNISVIKQDHHSCLSFISCCDNDCGPYFRYPQD